MSKTNTEEKSPLLFVLDSNDDLSRARYFERSRFNGISTGATAVFTHFPNYIGTCWITTAVCGLIFFMMILLVLSTMTALSLRVPICTAESDEPINKTIHLVHIHYSIYPEMEQVKFVKDLMTIYPQYHIRILSIVNNGDKSNIIEYNKVEKKNNMTVNETISTTTTAATTTKFVTEKKKVSKRRREIDFREANRFLDMLLHGTLLEKTDSVVAAVTPKIYPKEKPINTLEELIKLYPNNLTYENTTFNQQFFSSPLYPYYKFMNEKIQIFAIRVIQIWQFGGISYDLQASGNNLKEVLTNKFEKVQNFVVSEIESTENNKTTNKIRRPVVSVDDRALHLESKVPCHVFFGQLLMLLRRTNRLTTIKHIMQISIRSFCKHYAPEMDYCHSYMSI